MSDSKLCALTHCNNTPLPHSIHTFDYFQVKVHISLGGDW